MKAGFVSIFGKPNAGKSTLLNALIGEKLAIVSKKVQTTRHRIKGILTGKDHQIVFSDTPGIIRPKYKLHEKMMQEVKNALEDADLALLLVDIKDDWNECDKIFEALHLKVPAVVVLNKIDLVDKVKQKEAEIFFSGKKYCRKVISISALSGVNRKKFIRELIDLMPEGEPFYHGDEITDRSTRFFIAEMIREKIYDLFEEELPYQTTVMITEFKEKKELIKILADIIVQRETQKGILLGAGGSKIKKLGTESRKEIEKFLGKKIFLELFVKVKEKWRDNELYLKEYGY
ncbi:MAG: GTPase Era [Sphingobacteriales bacterium UTBCD1]|jgi:GTP-binding protein Era|nr:MAG: GTPase Era [Sphingobacteriales bacterium UTBCD1]